MLEILFDPCGGSRAVRLPGSKSEAARALILQYIYGAQRGRHVGLRGLPDCDDTRELAAALTRLRNGAGFNGEAMFDLGSGGTSLRFFVALVASLPGFRGVVDCAARLKQRPLTPLIAALRQAGAEIVGDGAPLRIVGRRLDGRGVTCGASVSSQFVSALMMASLLWERPFVPPVAPAVSGSYIDMTRKVTADFRLADEYRIEPDWSAASFFYQLAYLSPGREIKIERLVEPGRSLQGDSRSAALFASLGVDSDFKPDGSVAVKGNEEKILAVSSGAGAVRIDMGSTPDLVPPLAVALALRGVDFELRGVSHLRYKESDRLTALAVELAKVGIKLRVAPDSLRFDGAGSVSPCGPVFDSHGDHRIGMAMAVAAAALGEVRLAGESAISKSFPEFFGQMSKVGLMSRIVK